MFVTGRCGRPFLYKTELYGIKSALPGRQHERGIPLSNSPLCRGPAPHTPRQRFAAAPRPAPGAGPVETPRQRQHDQLADFATQAATYTAAHYNTWHNTTRAWVSLQARKSLPQTRTPSTDNSHGDTQSTRTTLTPANPGRLHGSYLARSGTAIPSDSTNAKPCCRQNSRTTSCRHAKTPALVSVFVPTPYDTGARATEPTIPPMFAYVQSRSRRSGCDQTDSAANNDEPAQGTPARQAPTEDAEAGIIPANAGTRAQDSPRPPTSLGGHRRQMYCACNCACFCARVCPTLNDRGAKANTAQPTPCSVPGVCRQLQLRVSPSCTGAQAHD